MQIRMQILKLSILLCLGYFFFFLSVTKNTNKIQINNTFTYHI